MSNLFKKPIGDQPCCAACGHYHYDTTSCKWSISMDHLETKTLIREAAKDRRRKLHRMLLDVDTMERHALSTLNAERDQDLKNAGYSTVELS